MNLKNDGILKPDQDFMKALEKLHDIPTLSVVATKVTNLLNDPNSNSSDIAQVLKKDQVLTAKILKLINSSYYAIPYEITDVQRALAYLGFNTVAQLVLCVSVFSVFSGESSSRFSMRDFWKHALGTAVMSELIAKRLKISKPEEAFTCGILHDIGKIVLHEISPESLFSIVDTASEKGASFIDVESELNLPPHCYLGEHIATKWGLPIIIRSAIRYHHTANIISSSSVIDTHKPIIAIVHIANRLVNNLDIGFSGDASKEPVSEDFLKFLDITEREIPFLEEKFQKEMMNASSFLRI